MAVPDDENASLMFNLLRWRGYTAIRSRTADTALELYDQDNGIDCVIADLDLVGVGGLHLAARLRDRTPNLPIIISGSKFAKEIIAALKECSNYGILRKPFIPLDFYEILEEVLPWHKSQRFGRNAA